MQTVRHVEIPIGTNSETALPRERGLISELLSCDIKLSIGHVPAYSQNTSTRGSDGHIETQSNFSPRGLYPTTGCVRLNLSAILKYNTERIVRVGLKSRRKRERGWWMPREGCTTKCMKVWNVQRYDKLNLVKSFLLTLGVEDPICHAAQLAAPKISCSTRTGSRFSGTSIFFVPDISR